ncbi:XPG/Rad2 endonuclease [Corchorus olitorius]|uniref:XPG/Rad2 endonuclease n=1 Tax=Corchorus olitorius TaxID=93759 RepID=A0A1R3IJV5_9ROSI|nr:XPG/Rad2 endonuclease [Corchorus olitorius]
MGIQGLLPLLKSIMVPIHIKDLEGCSVAIDTYSWLHKGALSCSTELCKGLRTSRHIEYCMHRVNLLRHYGVKPVLVFDGGLLPMKIEQENKRARARKENLTRAIEHEACGNSSAAYECYQKAVDISPSIAHELIMSLSGMGLRRAHALIKKFKSYDKVIKHLRYSSVSVPPLYEESFKKAILTFQHQRVYDPIIEDIVHLSDISDNTALIWNTPIPQQIAQGIARGDLDPFTQMAFEGLNNSSQLVLDGNLHLKSLKPESERKKLDLPCCSLTPKGFASLEAKRNFKAPRVSPNHSSAGTNSSISPDKHNIVEGASCVIDISLLSSPDSENTDNSGENGFSSKLPEYSESPSHAMEDDERSPDHAFPLESSRSIHRPSPVLHKEHDCSVILDAAKSKTRTESKKVTVKSRYFPTKQVNENDLEDRHGKFCSKGSIPNGLPDNRNTYINETTLKRKNSIECCEMENVNPKQIYMDSSHDDDGHSNLETFKETKAGEAKFGSNISHLGQYSDIAEKSMERFVSVISSFRFSSPGSRASGLRAPLKDARNTCTNRSSAAVDFSQFAYVPKNKKATLASRRL